MLAALFYRKVEKWYLAGLIIPRSEVRILPLQLDYDLLLNSRPAFCYAAGRHFEELVLGV